MNDRVEYVDSNHTYWYKGERYLSATQVLDLFKNHFDTEATAEAYAEKAGRDSGHWKETWGMVRTKSLERGNSIHKLQEDITNARGSELYQGHRFAIGNPERWPETVPYRDWPDGVYTEQLLWSHEYKVAGRADKLLFGSNGLDRILHIQDYKTNKKITMHGFGYPVRTSMMKYPICHLEDCHFVHYSLQLSLYMLMGEYLEFSPGTMSIKHYPHIPEMAPPGAKPPPPVIYTVPYLKKEVISMLNYLRKTA